MWGLEERRQGFQRPSEGCASFSPQRRPLLREPSHPGSRGCWTASQQRWCTWGHPVLVTKSFLTSVCFLEYIVFSFLPLSAATPSSLKVFFGCHCSLPQPYPVFYFRNCLDTRDTSTRCVQGSSVPGHCQNNCVLICKIHFLHWSLIAEKANGLKLSDQTWGQPAPQPGWKQPWKDHCFLKEEFGLFPLLLSNRL